jgi:chromosome partitioning protein
VEQPTFEFATKNASRPGARPFHMEQVRAAAFRGGHPVKQISFGFTWNEYRSVWRASSLNLRRSTWNVNSNAHRFGNVSRGTFERAFRAEMEHLFHVKRSQSTENPQPTSVSRETTCLGLMALLFFSTSESDLARVIAIANQKGGVGKTTTAVNLAACLATAEQPTLLIDCDSQANATAAIGFPKDPSRRTIYHTLILGEPFDRVVQKSQVDGLDVLPANKDLAGAEVELVNLESREYKLQGFLQPLRERYKFIILDCPPALGLMTLNALVAADSVMVPIQCEYLALEGVSELLDTLMRIRRTINPTLEIEGILLTMYDERTTLSRQVATDLRSFFGAQVFQSLIPRNVRLAEAPSFGKPIIFYDIHSKGAEGYTQLAQEVIANAEKRVGAGARSAHSGA